jgi:SAM-dependent methyltransferase
MIDFIKPTSYGAEYFSYQRLIGSFGGWANTTKFLPFLEPEDAVLDFGCGGGYLLANLPIRNKAGVEINPHARETAAKLGVKVYSCLDEIHDNYDIIISNHALEHCPRPLDEIKALKKILKPHGRMLFYVPSESSLHQYKPDDPNHHLYTWSPMTLGNLFKEAGLTIVFAEAYHHRWPPHHETIARVGGRPVFEFVARIYGFWKRNQISQVRCLAELPDSSC